LYHAKRIVSVANHAISLVANVKHSTNQQKFGASAINFDGTGDYLTISDNNDFHFNSDNFVIDLWVRFDNFTTSYQFLYAQTVDINNRCELFFDHGEQKGLSLQIINTSSVVVSCIQGNETGWIVNTWYHIAAVRSGGNFSIYRDGLQLQTTTYAGTLLDLSAEIRIGNSSIVPSAYFSGYIDEYRVSKGTDRDWTGASFDVPTTEY